MQRILSILCMSAGMCIGVAGCTPAPVIKYKSVPVTVTKYVPIPAKFTTPCPVPQPQNDTVAEAVSVAHARAVVIEQCGNTKLRAIRSIK